MSAKETTRDLLKLELWNYARQLGLVDGPPRALDDDLLRKALRVLDDLRWQEDAFSRRLATQLIAVAWEHSSSTQRMALREYFIVVLSRLGIAPSTAMIDREFAESGIYSPAASFFTELQTVVLQAPHEVTIGRSPFLLTRFQLRVLEAIAGNRLVGISAPTSAGKSFAIYLAIARHLQSNSSSVIYVVPTLSLVSQVAHDLRELLKATGAAQTPVYTTYRLSEKPSIFVLTQERAMGAIEDPSFPKKGFLVVDEVQNLERVAQDDDHRAKILYDLLKELKDSGRLDKIVLSGPRLSNIGNVGFEIFGELSNEQESQVAPVVNITYAVERRKNSYWLSQYVDTLESPNSLAITQSGHIAGYGQSLYTPQFLDYLSYLIAELGPSSKNIIFSPTSQQARNTACGLAERRPSPLPDDRLSSLADYLRATVHPSYTLADAVLKGVGYHTGRVPMHARAAIETAFRMGLLKDLVCTTTLMQGVNLPATTVIVRNPNLFLRRSSHGSARLSPYEFANLRGRAGRLLKDFVGRTVVLDASAFSDGESQEDLFRDEYKNLTPGYHDAFNENREQVVKDLEESAPAAPAPHKFLVTYVRQTLLRLGVNGFHRLREVGIHLSTEEINRTTDALRKLQIPREVALRHRYWDPFDLDTLYVEAKRSRMPSLPGNAWDIDVGATLHEIVSFHAQHLGYYFERSIGESRDDGFIWAVCLSAEQWAREDSLRDILLRRNFQEKIPDRIDDQINLLMTKVIYGVPTLLKPFADIFNQGASLLGAIEWGAYHPVTRLLLERGVPRDTAIDARRTIFSDLTGQEPEIDRLISARIASDASKLGFWSQIQLAEAIT